MKKSIIRLVLKLAGWKVVGTPPPDVKRYVLVSYPHTSTWDFFLLLSYAHLVDMPLKFMIKDTMFRFPLGPIMRALGGIPIDRSKSRNTVEKMAQAIKSADYIALSVPPEGTRKYVPHFKTGFYYVALAAEVPLLLSFIDGPNKRFGTGPLVHLTGVPDVDLEQMRAFYGEMKGINPEKTGPIAFKEVPPSSAT